MKKQKGRTSPDGNAGERDRNDHFGQWRSCGMRSLRSDTLTMRVTGVRITVFCSAIVIDVIVHCHTAGALYVKVQKTIVPIFVWLGFDPFRPVQNHNGDTKTRRLQTIVPRLTLCSCKSPLVLARNKNRNLLSIVPGANQHDEGRDVTIPMRHFDFDPSWRHCRHLDARWDTRRACAEGWAEMERGNVQNQGQVLGCSQPSRNRGSTHPDEASKRCC